MQKINIKAIILIISAMVAISSCAPNKKVKTSSVKTTKEKKDTTQVAVIVVDKNIEENKKAKAETVLVIENKNKSLEARKVESSTFPPVSILAVFNTNYPTAVQTAWSNEVMLIKVPKKELACYKVSFLESKNKSIVFYSLGGELIETRVQILPEQLPPHVYNAITTKYKNVMVLQATTYKSTVNSGSYTAKITSDMYPEAQEIVLTENGTFVE